jgi:chromosome segregation ATPase
MSKASISRSPKPKSASAKELKLKVDELTEEVERLRTENDEIKTKFQMICKKIVDNIDLSEYAFIDPNIEPYMIDIRDLFHMIQKLSLLAATTNSSDKIESHMERLETRITELANENSDYIKNKLKLHERLEFIMQERDVWKRNAETLKAMYSKLGSFFVLVIF